MKSGLYKVSFEIQLINCEDATQDEVDGAVREVFQETMDAGHFLEVRSYEFIEGTEVDYTEEEDEIPEVNFDEVEEHA